MIKNIYIAVTNDLVTDNRVHKVSSTLLKSGANVTLIGRELKKSKYEFDRPYSTKLFSLPFKKGPLFYACYNIRLFFFLLFKPFDLVIANDLDTLLACFLASKIKRKKLVYDSHEYFTEVPELYNRNFPKKVWLSIEKFILPKLKFAYTVSNSIAETYKKKYGIEMQVIRNVPIKNKPEQTTNQNTTKNILYQGSLNVGRGLEHMILAMEYIANAKFIIIGDGDITEDLRLLIEKNNLGEKVEMKGRLTIDELKHETPKADLGIALEENIGLNYYYALPNKLFDYIQASVPVIVSPFPEMQKIVRKYDIGVVYEHKSPIILAEKINEIFDLEKRYTKWKENTKTAAEDLCWENEEKKLIEIYKQAGLLF